MKIKVKRKKHLREGRVLKGFVYNVMENGKVGTHI